MVTQDYDICLKKRAFPEAINGFYEPYRGFVVNPQPQDYSICFKYSLITKCIKI